MNEVNEIWEKYEDIREKHRMWDIGENVKMCHRFYEGDQWYGIEKSGERLPKYNFIRSVVDYKVSMVAKNDMSIHYSPGAGKCNTRVYDAVCEGFNEIAAAAWENTDMTGKMWDVVKNACITGDSYLYFYDSDFNSQLISKENIYFADESLKELQNQEFIIIRERRTVEAVKKEALKNGIKEEALDLIVPDDDENETDAEKIRNKKCTSLLYLFKRDGEVCYLRCVRQLIYSPEKTLFGLKLYPVCAFVWNGKHNSARGIGEVYEMIPNQISANALLVRREINNKMTGYAKPVYNSDLIENPESISKVGTAVKISGPGIGNVTDAFSYISPAPMSGTVKQLQDELLSVTRELGGAGDSALGIINPEEASGTAIMAVMEQATLSLNEHTNSYRRFIEEVARIWVNMWLTYHPEGMKATYEEDGEERATLIPSRILEKMQLHVKVDVSPVNAFSKYAREQALETALTKNYITFEEYVDALDDDASAPKGKFEKIIAKRRGGGENETERG